MDYILVIGIVLCVLALQEFVTNIAQLLKETKQLKAAGKTPLTARNSTTVVIALLAELLVVVLFIKLLYSGEPVNVGVYKVAALFLVGNIVRVVAAYLTAWATWSFFIALDRRKMKKQIEKEQDTAL